jgi:hypothetical protein
MERRLFLSPKEKLLRVLLDDKELQKLKEESQKAGFRSVSDFVRYVTIGEGRRLQEDVKKILEKLEEK